MSDKAEELKRIDVAARKLEAELRAINAKNLAAYSAAGPAVLNIYLSAVVEQRNRLGYWWPFK